MTTRSGLPPSSSPSTTRSAKRPSLAGAFTLRLYNRLHLGPGRRDQERVLVSLVADTVRGAHRAVRDSRAPSRPAGARDPRRSLRDEPLDRGADQAAARPSRPAPCARRRSRQRDEARALARLDEGDLAVRLENGPLHFAQVSDSLESRSLADLVDGQAFASRVALEHISILHDDDRRALDHRPRARESEPDPRDEDLQQGDRPDRQERTGERIVVLRQPLL